MLFPMKIHFLILIFLIFATQNLLAASSGFSRYSQILDRRPFASVISAEEEARGNVVTVVEPPEFVKDLRMCAITESPAGIKVGFVNIRIKPPQPYYIYVGDADDGIELVDANYEKEGALLRKDGKQYWMYMGGITPAETVPAKKKKPSSIAPVAMRSSKSGATFRPDASSTSYAERRQKRLEQMRKRAESARKMSDKQVEEKLQNYQMNLIRKGLTPLPIKLTPEMDRQLVEEGILPAFKE